MTQVPVILFGDGIAAYGAIRALGPKRIPIYVVSPKGDGVCNASRYVKKGLLIDANDSNFIDKLRGWICREVGSEAVLMVAGDDNYLDSLSKNYDYLGPNLKPTFPSWDVVQKVRQKRETYQIAERIGIPVPKTCYVTSEHDLHNFLASGMNGNYPLLMKSEHSKDFMNKYGTKGIISHCEKDIIENYSRYEGFFGKLLLQEMIPGGENQLLNLIGIYNRNADPVQIFMNRKRRSSGQFLSCTLMETMWSIDVLEYSNRLVKEIGYFGYANPEYKYDVRDGRIKLMEINGRISMSNSHALCCGLNIIYTLYEEALEGPLESVTKPNRDYPDNVLWWMPAEDLAAAIEMFKQGSLGLSEYINSLRGSRYIFEPINLRDPNVLKSQVLTLFRALISRIIGA
ncbi:MAG TPA: ATP-grasp domain-containing protein [Bacillota bacterium]|nr:ATP-grasp domain-containing protein [Bacillota bacterium]